MNNIESQTLIDIAIQQCGSAEAAYDIALMNGLSVTDELTPGLELSIPEIANKSIAAYYINNIIVPATVSDNKIEESNLERIFFSEMPVEFS